MPSIDQFIIKDTPSKKFKKVAHRPWTILETNEQPAEIKQDDPLIEGIPSEPIAPASLETSPAPSDDIDDEAARYDLSKPYLTKSHPFKPSTSRQVPSREFDEILPTEPYPNRTPIVPEQLENNSGTIQEQTQNSTRFVPKSFPNNQGTNKEQSGYNSSTIFDIRVQNETSLKYAHLVGFQKKVFLFIAKRCLAADSLISGPLYKADFQANLSNDLDTIKTSIKRLVHKGFLSRVLSKSGAGGFSVFSIPEDLKSIVSEDLDRTNVPEQFWNNSGTVPVPISSSNYINTTTKTPESFGNNSGTNLEQSEPLDLEWDQIDIVPLAEIGFSKKHIAQLQKGELTPEIVQDSIWAFAFDLKHNGVANKIKTQPLNFFMGILRLNYPYTAPENYQDPKTLAMKQYLDKKKQMRDDKKKIEEELFQLSFEEWSENLSDEESNIIIPEARYREYPMKDGFLKTYFRKEIWPKNQGK